MVEAGEPFMLFLDLGLFRTFRQELESEEPREECISLVVTSLTSLTYLWDVMVLEVT